MDAIDFVNRYPAYIAQLEKVVKPEYKAAIKKMKELDPHDLVEPQHYFNSGAEAVGMVFGLLLREIKDGPMPKKLSKEERQLKLSSQIEAAKELLAVNGIQSQGLWCIEDIIDKAKEMRKQCSKKDALIILRNIEQNFDAAYGISWQTIEQYVEDYFKDKKPKAE